LQRQTELAVKAIVCGNTAFKASTATANPGALEEYKQYADIEAVVAKMRQSKL
jgi:acetoacetyl-CoA synthetase